MSALHDQLIAQLLTSITSGVQLLLLHIPLASMQASLGLSLEWLFQSVQVSVCTHFLKAVGVI